MPDKVRERFYFEALRKAVDDVPSGKATEPEPPDFLLVKDGHRLGIELTTFHLPPLPGERPHQEQQSLKNRVVELAEQLHHEKGGPALYVRAIFQPRPALKKKDTQRLAEALAESVLRCQVPSSVTDPAAEIPWGQRPAEIAKIIILGSVDGVDRLWKADAGGWVATVSPDQVAAEVRRKVKREPLARNRCHELWLVIVNEPGIHAAPAEIGKEAREYTYEGPFDRLIWFLPYGPTAIDLKCRNSAA